MRAVDTTPAAIAEAAFLSAYPLLAGRRRMAEATAVDEPEPATLRAPVNTLVHRRATPDTLRCSGWLDLGREPLVLTVPNTRGRYYALWLRDAWGEVFASLGARTTGTGHRSFVVIGPRHRGMHLPAGLTPIVSPTRVVRITGCIEAVSESDAAAQDGFRLASLVEAVDEPPREPLAPIGDIEGMPAATFFATVARLAADDPPDRSRRETLDRLRGLDAEAGLERGVQRGWAAVRAAAEPAPDDCGWTRVATDPTPDVLHTRASIDSEHRPLSGAHRYVLRFDPDAAPPVHGFWELTTGARSIGDRHPLALALDGALTVHIQHAPPSRAQRWNWLPAPAGAFSAELHLYWPRETTWSPPAITRL